VSSAKRLLTPQGLGLLAALVTGAGLLNHQLVRLGTTPPHEARTPIWPTEGPSSQPTSAGASGVPFPYPSAGASGAPLPYPSAGAAGAPLPYPSAGAAGVPFPYPSAGASGAPYPRPQPIIVPRSPFEYKEMMCTWSADLERWSPSCPLRAACDVPQLYWYNKQLWAIYLTFDKGHIRLTRSKVMRKSDNRFWLGRPDLLHVTHETSPVLVDPSVLPLPTGQLRMFYVVPDFSSNTDPARIRTDIYSAISSDATTWVKEPGCRLHGTGLVDPEAALTPDGGYRLFFTSGSDHYARSAYSRDGLTFAPEAGNRLDGGVTSTLRLADHSYITAFESRPVRGKKHPLLLARSRDGLSFDPPSPIKLPEKLHPRTDLESPSLVRLPDQSWLLVYIKNTVRISQGGPPPKPSPSGP
jgi:hypothetical protein